MKYSKMNFLILIFSLICNLYFVNSLPTTPKFLRKTPPYNKEFGPSEAEKWLKKYDYMQDTDEEGPAATKDLSGALKQMQHNAGINETGELDEETKNLMKQSRCGNSDVKISVSKRFSAVARWRYRSLTYSISNYPTISYNLQNYNNVDYYIAKAFKYWSDAANLSFRKVSGYSDIRIGFYSRSHGDGNPFDGYGGVLAHAYFPPIGNIHFDNDEYWSSNQYGGSNLEQVMTHEIGHALGLSHSSRSSAVMYAYYNYKANFALDQDDINGIVYLYGRKSGQTTTTTTTTTTTRSGTVNRSWWYWFFRFFNFG